jgi:hypothetical protein
MYLIVFCPSSLFICMCNIFSDVAKSIIVFIAISTAFFSATWLMLKRVQYFIASFSCAHFQQSVPI